MKEKDIEKKICDYVKEKGGIAYKFTSPARASVPDRLIVLPGCAPFFMEIKAENGKLSSGQEREIKRLWDMGQQVWIVYSVEEGKAVVDEEERAGKRYERLREWYRAVNERP